MGKRKPKATYYIGRIARRFTWQVTETSRQSITLTYGMQLPEGFTPEPPSLFSDTKPPALDAEPPADTPDTSDSE